MVVFHKNNIPTLFLSSKYLCSATFYRCPCACAGGRRGKCHLPAPLFSKFPTMLHNQYEQTCLLFALSCVNCFFFFFNCFFNVASLCRAPISSRAVTQLYHSLSSSLSAESDDLKFQFPSPTGFKNSQNSAPLVFKAKCYGD